MKFIRQMKNINLLLILFKSKEILSLIINSFFCHISVENGDEDDDSRHGNESQSTDLADILADNPRKIKNYIEINLYSISDSVSPSFTPKSNHEHV